MKSHELVRYIPLINPTVHLVRTNSASTNLLRDFIGGQGAHLFYRDLRAQTFQELQATKQYTIQYFVDDSHGYHVLLLYNII
jgi:hypothetical protein